MRLFGCDARGLAWRSVALLTLAAATLPAQSRRRFGQGPTTEFGVALGGSFPVGSYGDVAGSGWHAGVLLNVLSPVNTLGFRADVMYHGLGSTDYPNFRYNPSLISGTANLLYGLPTESRSVRPYVLGGFGIYGVRTQYQYANTRVGSTRTSNTETKFGLNGGGGVSFDLSGFGAFVEARYHYIVGGLGQDQFGSGRAAPIIPVSFGVTFR